MCVSNLHIHIFTNVLKFGRYDPNLFFSWPSQILLFSQSFLLPAIGNKPLSLLPRSAERFCDPSFYFLIIFFFSFDWVKLKIIFGIVLFSPREKNREGNHLWQWIIEIFITVRPYKLCTKRATKE